MYISRPALSIVCIILVLGLITTTAVGIDCTTGEPKYVTPGDSVTLTGPNPPSGITYSYLWNIYNPDGTVASNLDGTDAISADQSITFTTPDASKSENYYVATLLVTDTREGGCALSSCMKIVVNKDNSCGINGEKSVCQTDTAQEYTYTGNADISDKKVATLTWFVDKTKVAEKDTTGKYTVDWTKFWDSKASAGTQVHTITVEVHSKKGNQVLSSCSLDVNVLPLPSTEITPT